MLGNSLQEPWRSIILIESDTRKILTKEAMIAKGVQYLGKRNILFSLDKKY